MGIVQLYEYMRWEMIVYICKYKNTNVYKHFRLADQHPSKDNNSVYSKI